MNTTGRPSYCMTKLNFQSSPHILEPINLLSIEAYQTRVKVASKMNYYTSVAPKCAYQLKSPDYRNNTSEYIAKCCHFHGCQKFDFIKGDTVCKDNNDEENWRISGKGKKWMDALTINHYSRSLEKFALKQKTWKTSTGEVMAGQTSAQAASSYDIPKFLARSVGFHYDDTALRYSCQLREVLRNMTGEKEYLRPGSFWYRNPEFGKTISDPDKRGRYGRANPPGFKYWEPSPYNYHGGVHGDVSADRSVAEKELLLSATAATAAATAATAATATAATAAPAAPAADKLVIEKLAVTTAGGGGGEGRAPEPSSSGPSEAIPLNPAESVIMPESGAHGNGTRSYSHKGKNGDGKSGNYAKRKQKKNGKVEINEKKNGKSEITEAKSDLIESHRA